jgi:uncharacterized protein DUF4124
MLLFASAATAGETIYTFVDELGVAHFSNVPYDPRYRPRSDPAAESVKASPSKSNGPQEERIGDEEQMKSNDSDSGNPPRDR